MVHHHTKKIAEEIKRNDFRVAIFGSARIKPKDKSYKQIYQLAKEIGKHNLDVVTGGGPGLMEAANAGHQAGKHAGGHSGNGVHSIGLTIELPMESKGNKYLDMREHFEHFSQRLDDFMVLSNIMVITPGGVGTCLEFFYSWQLTQVKHICPIPIIVVGTMWKGLLKWIKNFPLKKGLISPQDMNNIHYAKNNAEVMEIIQEFHENYQKEGENFCLNYKKYRLN